MIIIFFFYLITLLTNVYNEHKQTHKQNKQTNKQTEEKKLDKMSSNAILSSVSLLETVERVIHPTFLLSGGKRLADSGYAGFAASLEKKFERKHGACKGDFYTPGDLKAMLLKDQCETHTPLQKGWREHSIKQVEQKNAKGVVVGIMHTLDRPLENSAKKTTYKDILEGTDNGTIKVQFSKSVKMKKLSDGTEKETVTIFANFWSEWTEEDGYTNFVFEPLRGEPYPYYTSTWTQSSSPAYQMLARYLSTRMTGEFCSPWGNGTLEMFNAMLSPEIDYDATFAVRLLH